MYLIPQVHVSTNVSCHMEKAANLKSGFALMMPQPMHYPQKDSIPTRSQEDFQPTKIRQNMESIHYPQKICQNMES